MRLRLVMQFRRRAAFIGFLLLASAVAPGAAQPANTSGVKDPGPTAPKTDRYGDPLPTGALARFGTTRWQHAAAVRFVAFLPDGETVVTAAPDLTVRLWQLATGKELRRITVPNPPPAVAPKKPMAMPGAARQLLVALTKNGKTLATLAGDTIRLWDAANGKQLQQIDAPASGITALSFAPDGQFLALRTSDESVVILDAASGKEARRAQVKDRQPAALRISSAGPAAGDDDGGLAYSPDGKMLASIGSELIQKKETFFVRLLDATTGAELRRIAAAPKRPASVAFSPDGKLVAFASGTEVRVHDPATGKEMRNFDAAVGLATLVFSPDGKMLAGVCHDRTVRLWNADSGAELQRLGEAVSPKQVNAFRKGPLSVPQALAFSPDSATIMAGTGNSVRQWATATGKEQGLADGHRGTVLYLSVAQDGKTLISLGGDGTIRSWDLAELRELSRFQQLGSWCMACAPDGRTVALAVAGDGTIRLHDTASGKELRQLTGYRYPPGALAFSPNGKTLASYSAGDLLIRLHETATGKLLREISLQTNAMTRGIQVGAAANADSPRLAFSPDGRTVLAQFPAKSGRGRIMVDDEPAVAASTIVRRWDAATGRELPKLNLPAQRGIGSIALSPDGRMFASENPDGTVSLWEIASGKERSHFGELAPFPPKGGDTPFASAGTSRAGVSALAFSPDGSMLAYRGNGNSLRIWSVRTASDVGKFIGHDGAIGALAFTRDGKRVITGSGDTTMLLWDVARFEPDRVPAASALQATELADLWRELLHEDAAKAFASMRKLAAAPKQAVPLLRDCIKPAVPADPKLLQRLITELDSDNFEVRAAAVAGLEKLGDLAVPSLERARDSDVALETNRRIDNLLGRLFDRALTAEQIRQVRAIEVLEQCRTPESRQVLQALAAGAPGALTTQHAQAALER